VTFTSNVDRVAYSSSNEQIATVSANGGITGIGAGSVTITATKDWLYGWNDCVDGYK
jgi:Bacterial Ig-like domain (group 2).